MPKKKQISRVSNFEVFAELSRTNSKALAIGSLANLANVKVLYRGTQREHTIVAIAIGGDLIEQIMNDEYCGGLVLCKKEAFERMKASLERGS